MTIKQCGVYQITNTITGDFYVGSSANIANRILTHCNKLSKNKHYNPNLQNDWNQYAEQAFEFTTILLCDPENQLYYEQTCIDILKPTYNIAKSATAPMLGRKMSVEARRKISESKSGEAQRGEKNPFFGKHHSEATRAKMRNAQKGENSHNFGKHPTDETRKKLSEAHSGKNSYLFGKHLSEITRAKLSEAHSGNKSYNWIDISDEEIMEMKSFRAQGYTYQKIADIFGISYSTVWKRLHNYINN